MRRLTLLADEAPDSEDDLPRARPRAVSVPGAEEVQVHHLAAPGAGQDLVAVYLFEADGRLSYLLPRAERPPGVSWVASTGQSLLAADDRELAASVPRLTATGQTNCALLLPLAERGEVEAVVMLVRRLSAPSTSARSSSRHAGRPGCHGARAGARAHRGRHRPVAGCMNHRAMRRRLDEEIDRAARTGNPLSCLLMDLDNFKLVNDRHGHQAGDATLRGRRPGAGGRVPRIRPGRALRRRRVRRDPAERRPGERHRRGNAGARAAAGAALAAGRRRGVSASIGVAQWQAPMTTDELLAACDVALLRSKRQGKGRVTGASQAIG